MNRLLALSLAASVPTLALWFAAPDERLQRGLAVPPFAWPSMLIVQALTAIPLALALTEAVRRRAEFIIPAWLSPLVGSLVATGGYFAAVPLGDFLDDLGADFLTRCFARSSFCIALAAPWFIAHPKPRELGGGLFVIAAMVIAFVVPGIYADKLAGDNTNAAQDELAAQRFVDAGIFLAAACDLDPNRVIVEEKSQLKLPAAIQRLDDTIRGQTEDLKKFDPKSLSPSVRIEYARLLLGLNRNAEATELLDELTESEPKAKLFLGQLYHRQRRYSQSDEILRGFLASALPAETSDRAIRSDCRAAFELLAESATNRGSNAEREAVLREGLVKLPAESGYFHFQLGRHFQMTGRPFAALAEFDEAVKIDPELAGRIAPLRTAIHESTPACLVGR